MKCAACKFESELISDSEYEGHKKWDDKELTTVPAWEELEVMIYRGAETLIYSCPKCGTIKMQMNEDVLK